MYPDCVSIPTSLILLKSKITLSGECVSQYEFSVDFYLLFRVSPHPFEYHRAKLKNILH